jgi:hypothetical protein
MEDKIRTLHPAGKQGVHINREKYDAIREAILSALREHGELTFTALAARVKQQIEDRFDGSVTWYTTTVKLDLEARGEVIRVPKSIPQRLNLAPCAACEE